MPFSSQESIIISEAKCQIASAVIEVKRSEVYRVNEEILAVISTNEGKALFFTSNRVIIAKLASLGSILGMRLAFGLVGEFLQRHKEAKKEEQLSEFSPESILKADKKNLEIPYTEITQVELFKKWLVGKLLRITVGKTKRVFIVDKPKKLQDCANALRPILGDKMIVS